MQISTNYVLVKKVEEEVKEGFQAVEVQDSFVVKGEVVKIPTSHPVHVGDHKLNIGDVVMFRKYSPDTMETEIEGEVMKFINTSDLLAVI